MVAEQKQVSLSGGTFRLVTFGLRWRRERARGRVGPSCKPEPRSHSMSPQFVLYIRSAHVPGYVRGTAVKLDTKVKVVARKPTKRTPDFLAFPRNKPKPSLLTRSRAIMAHWGPCFACQFCLARTASRNSEAC